MRTILKVVAVCVIISAVACWPITTRLRGHTALVTWAVVSPDAKYAATGSNSDKTVRIWEVATRKQLAVLAKSEQQIMSLMFSPDGEILASGDEDSAITLWNVADGKELLRLRGHGSAVLSVAFSPDGKRLVSRSKDKTVKVWDLTTGKELFALLPGLDYVSSVVYSPDGKLLACAGWFGPGSEIQLRDAKTGKELHVLAKPKWRVSELRFSPDSATLCATDQDTLALWNVASGKERDCECPKWLENDDDHIRSLTFSPDSRTLAVGHSEAIGLWDVASGKNTTTFTNDGPNRYLGFVDRFLLDPEERRPPSLITAVFKSNGNLMVVGRRFETVALWRLTSVNLKK